MIDPLVMFVREEQRKAARQALRQARIPLGADFHTLSAVTVEKLIAIADSWRYRKPESANGSRARYFHAMLQRRANMRKVNPK
jgi:hypothetical protein